MMSRSPTIWTLNIDLLINSLYVIHQHCKQDSLFYIPLHWLHGYLRILFFLLLPWPHFLSLTCWLHLFIPFQIAGETQDTPSPLHIHSHSSPMWSHPIPLSLPSIPYLLLRMNFIKAQTSTRFFLPSVEYPRNHSQVQCNEVFLLLFSSRSYIVLGLYYILS
jgi:hypothetical protein